MGAGPDNFGDPLDFAFGKSATCIIVCESKQRCQDLTILAEACNCHVENDNHAEGVAILKAGGPQVDYLLIELLSISDKAEDSLSKIARYLEQNRSHLLLWTDMALLESAYATLPSDRCHYLVDANDAEAMPILSGALEKLVANQLHDKGRRGDYGSLHRISDELAQFAKALAQMAQSERDKKLSDKPVSFRPAPPDIFQRFVTGADDAEPEVTAAMVRQMIKLRRLRDSFFDPSLFADPAWDILLDLMAARLEGQPISVSSLCIAAAVPATTALRWISAMTESGLLIREQDPEDARRVFIALSDEAAASLHQYLIEIQKRPSPIV